MLESETGDLIDSLVIYGLTPVQAQIYITLLKLGRSAAKPVSESADINRVDVYRALKRLSKLGLIEEILGARIEFSAIEPDQALEILIEQKSGQVDRLRANKLQLERRLQLLALSGPVSRLQNETDETELYVKVLSGEQVFRRLKTLIINSTSEIIKVLSSKSLGLYERVGIPEIEHEKMLAGVKTRVVTNITIENSHHAETYARAVSLRHSNNLSSHLRYTIVDRTLLLLPVGEPPGSLGEATALWTNSKALTAGLLNDFEKLWIESIPADERIADLRARAIL